MDWRLQVIAGTAAIVGTAAYCLSILVARTHGPHAKALAIAGCLASLGSWAVALLIVATVPVAT
jgi:hypothetical protein